MKSGLHICSSRPKEAYRDVFDPDDRIRVSQIALGFIIHKLQNISFLDSSQDAKGLAFQKFLSHREKDGRGQFFTPEPVIDFCVEMIQPRLSETIIDPACGSGGFLMSALKYLRNNFAEADSAKIISANLYGFDINKSIAGIAKMKFLLEANVKVNIFCANSLDGSYDLLSENSDGFDIVLTNPPFGTGGKITNRQILTKFDLGYKWVNVGDKYNKTNRISNGQPAEILFVERCLQLLKEGGRMGIVLPNGHFENPSLEYIRFYIRQKAKILAIVNLPQETFIPFGTGVKHHCFFAEETLNISSEYPIFSEK
ncbi:MAG: N-6 DNA methylase [Desulfobacteraceae bacterium]|nr:N-6 DNA methylase [Desulfobacteraceae bacterium]